MFFRHVQRGRLLSGLQVKHVNERFKEEPNKEVVLMCIGVTSGVGRLLFGRIADYVPGVKKVYLQVLSLVLSPSKSIPSPRVSLYVCICSNSSVKMRTIF